MELKTPPTRPTVVTWYKVYAAFMTLLYAACMVLGGVVLYFRRELVDPESPEGLWIVMGTMLIGMGFVFAAVFAAGVFLPPRPWTWIYHLVLICLALTSPCFIPICVPLLIFWIKPETRAYFGRPDTASGLTRVPPTQ